MSIIRFAFPLEQQSLMDHWLIMGALERILISKTAAWYLDHRAIFIKTMALNNYLVREEGHKARKQKREVRCIFVKALSNKQLCKPSQKR